MSRSVKKGPFVQEALLKRIDEMNKNGTKTAAYVGVTDVEEIRAALA